MTVWHEKPTSKYDVWTVFTIALIHLQNIIKVYLWCLYLLLKEKALIFEHADGYTEIKRSLSTRHEMYMWDNDFTGEHTLPTLFPWLSAPHPSRVSSTPPVIALQNTAILSSALIHPGLPVCSLLSPWVVSDSRLPFGVGDGLGKALKQCWYVLACCPGVQRAGYWSQRELRTNVVNEDTRLGSRRAKETLNGLKCK